MGTRTPCPPLFWGWDPAAGSAGRAQASHEPGQLVPITAPLAPFRQPQAMGKPNFGGARSRGCRRGGRTPRHPAPPLLYPLAPGIRFLTRPPGQSRDGDASPSLQPTAPLDAPCLSFPFCASKAPDAAIRDPIFPPLPLGCISLGKKPPDCRSKASVGLPSTRGTLSHAAYPSIVLSVGERRSLGPGDAGAASAALLCRWIEEAKRQLENFGNRSVLHRVGGKEETRGDAAPAPSRLHVMLRHRAESAPAQGPAARDPAPGTASCPGDVLSPQHPALGTPPRPRVALLPHGRGAACAPGRPTILPSTPGRAEHPLA